MPFVSKATGLPLAKLAARVMAGRTLAELGAREVRPQHVSVKESVFPFVKFEGVDTILGPEMRSTGEVMGIDKDFGLAFCEGPDGGRQPAAQARHRVPVTARRGQGRRRDGGPAAWSSSGFQLVATRGTARTSAAAGLEVRDVNKVSEGRPHCVDAMEAGEVEIVVNTTEGRQAIEDSHSLGARRCWRASRISPPCERRGPRSRRSPAEVREGLRVAPLQSYHGRGSMSEKYPMTPAGHGKLKAALKQLKDVDRPANARAIEIARGHGDLSENADYSAAKEEQGMIEARIRELRDQAGPGGGHRSDQSQR